MPKINREEYEVLKELDDKYKWIARDNNNILWVYAQKPQKDNWDTWQISGICATKVNVDLFQFIQWEDPEPYNIAELIKEYEYHNEPVKLAGGLSITQAKYDKYLEEHIKELENEGEETEVKKDKTWAMNQVNNLDGVRIKGNFADFTTIPKDKAIRIISDMDEPEVLSEAWLDEHTWNNHYVGRPFVYVDDIQEVIVPKQEITFEQAYDKLREESILSEKSFDYYWNCINDNMEIDEPGNLLVPRQELPVIPQFVADWIDSRKNNYPSDVIGVYLRMNESSANEQTREVLSWIHESKLNRGSFARAWLDGFTIADEEEEQKYILSINITDKASKTNYETYLNKRGIFHSMENESFNSEEFNWSEEEIKDLENGEILFEHFAVTVEELEE